ncbi:cupin domain-containing protein [Variovorax sp. HW608]|uniref:cupin domain-containing protein n=1 Tax=Variovorax sp. HW608 TaxID=1034889 RepID=UPI001E516F49|nr:cupin domain-containing protein [Variovorax sp. HW608]
MRTRYVCRLAFLGAASAFFVLPASVSAADAGDPMMVTPGAIKWGDAPPSIPKGAKLAVLMGDPSKEGPFVMRLKTPANYKIAPHTHTQAEQITVLSGTLILGMGEKIDKAHESALPGRGLPHARGQDAALRHVEGADGDPGERQRTLRHQLPESGGQPGQVGQAIAAPTATWPPLGCRPSRGSGRPPCLP